MITNLDFMVLNAIQTLRGDVLDAAMIFLTYLGSCGIVWIVPAAVLTLRKNSRRDGVLIFLAMTFALIFGNLVLKYIVMRPRPFTFPQAIVNEDNLAIAVPMGRWSFPSSHAATSFAAAVGFFFADKRWGTAAFVMAALIGFSRLYLYVHFFTDVVVGAALGLLCAFAAKWTLDRLWDVKKTEDAV